MLYLYFPDIKRWTKQSKRNSKQVNNFTVLLSSSEAPPVPGPRPREPPHPHPCRIPPEINLKSSQSFLPFPMHGSVNVIDQKSIHELSAHLVFKVTILLPEIIDVRGVAAILPSHEGDILAGLLQDLRPAALVTLPFNYVITRT